ncbi:uncharacterized protein LOC118438548 [Folsomia candida]|uniref:uncharacterized protein LOC118438548 n=1 Tax=Folsomia candida TaxID=158441 RepID=UPI0016054254|nr:uncharacterized protein LOC118438548 [Folsomia candida]
MIAMPNFDKRIALIVTLLFCMPSNLSAQIVLHGGLISVPSMTMEDFNSQKCFTIRAKTPGKWLITGNLSKEFMTSNWSLVPYTWVEFCLKSAMSDMNAKIQAFQSTMVHLKEEDASFAIAGFRQIEEILARFSEASSIFRKYPLHVGPLVLGFFPVMAVYVEYVGKKFPNIEQDWRSILANKGLWVLEVYKKLAINKMIEAVQSYYAVYHRYDGHHSSVFYGQADHDKIFPLSNFLEISRTSELGQFPQNIRCRKAGPSVGCRWKGPSHPALENNSYDVYRVECIIDKLSGQEILAESALAIQRMVVIYNTNWEENVRVNCLIDYIKVIDYLYARMFWGVGSLTI